MTFPPYSRHRLLLITLLVAIVFGNTVGHGFVWDDRIFVEFKEVYRNFDLASIFFTLKTNELEYLPVRDLTYLIDFALWGKSTVGFHFSNIVWYWLNVIAVYLLSNKIAELFSGNSPDGKPGEYSKTTGLLTAALFAVHPIHCETVNFITCRNALVSGCFFFFSCFCYLQYLTAESNKKRPFYWAALACFLLSLFAKATGIILPVVLLLFTCYFARSLRWQRWLVLLPFFLLSAGGFFLFREVAHKTRLMPEVPFCISASCLSEKAAVAFQIPFFYLYKLFIPFGYTIDYDMKQFGVHISDPRSVGALILFVCTGFLVWHFRDRKPFVLFCSAWYLITLLPLLHIFPTIPVVADRYAFLPSLPIIFFVVSVAVRRATHQKLWLWWSFLLILALLSALSIQQNRTWKNNRTLWEHTLHVNPRSSLALGALAGISFHDKEYDKALLLAKRANDLNSNDFEYDRMRGELFLRNFRPDDAVIMFKSALAKNKESVEILISLGRAYQLLGNSQMAEQCYLDALNSNEVYLPGNLKEQAAIMLRNMERTK